MTLLELLIAMAIMLMVCGTLGSLAKAIQQGFEYTEGHGTATQHARVVLDRIARTVSEATANGQFPGMIVLAEEESSWRFPDTLVVWHPDDNPADPHGLPRFDELIVYCPDPQVPNRLLEITVPTDARPVPPVDDQAAWAVEIEAIKTSQTSRTVTLTELMRTCAVTELVDNSRRAAVRFETRLRPSASQWDDYQKGNLDWDALPWVQGIYGPETGLRQAWLRMELQLMPTDTAGGSRRPQRAIPYFGSAALYYELHR